MKTSTMVSRLQRMDPVKFEARYSNRDGIQYGWVRESNFSIEELKPFLRRLPPREQDLIQMYFDFKKNQKDIAKMFGVTQGAISSRLSRAKERLLFLRDLPKITDEEIDRDLSPIFSPLEIEIIKGMKETTCQSKTAQIINERHNYASRDVKMTQIKVRHRFDKCIKSLGKLMVQHQELKKYYDLLTMLRDNLYLLHEVKLPHFYRGEFVVCSLND